MEYSEFTGKNTEEALKLASEKLGLPLDRLEIEVISSGSSGIFSIFGGKKAKVRVRPIDQSHEDEMARMMEEFSSNGSSKDNGSSTRQNENKEHRARAKSSEARESVEQHVRPAIKEPVSQAADLESLGGDTSPHESDSEENNRRTEDPKVVGVAQDVLTRLLSPLDSDAKVLVSQSDNGIRLEIDGGEPGIIIGRRGQTLEALQYITTRIVSHQEGRPVKISIDAGGYRKRRRDNMVDLAHKMASKARNTRKPVSVGPYGGPGPPRNSLGAA